MKFSFVDRLVLTPIELVGSIKASLMIFGILFIINLSGIVSFGRIDFLGYIGALIVGCVLVPVLLPWIPGKAFAWKGWLLGVLWALTLNFLYGWPDHQVYESLRGWAYLFILPAISAFYAMNFTGSSTYTSLSGVSKEMKYAVPAIISSLFIGVFLILISII